jgi:hypothetical protein
MNCSGDVGCGGGGSGGNSGGAYFFLGARSSVALPSFLFLFLFISTFYLSLCTSSS